MANQLSARYANALFTLAMETGKLSEFYDQAVSVREALTHSDMPGIMDNPNVTRAEKRAFLDDVFEGKIHELLYGLLSLMFSKNHEKRIVPTLDDFVTMVDAHNGKTTAVLVSATELSDDKIALMKDVLVRKLNKQVEISSSVDTSIIGGFYIFVDGYLIDRTVSKQLNDMRDSIKNALKGLV
jgi:F-type H+-transporting ATPase subunit delta